jgi:4-amino-4-deoxy-L-arabinose transferase-like glycosyltransferase
MEKAKKILPIVLISLVIIINASLGIPRLSRFSAVDEPYWTYDRTSKFWNAIKEQKWKSTKINDKPGITVAILSGWGLTQIDPMPFKSLRGDPKTDAQIQDIDKINFAFRLPIFLFTLALLPLFYFFLKKLFGLSVALAGFMFIGLSPTLFGISLIINPDSLFWLFLPLSILSYLIFQKNESKKYLYISGIFLGLSLLTKYVGNILYVFFLVIPFLDYIFSENKPNLGKYLKKQFIYYLILVLISLITFFALFPATWVNPKLILSGTVLSKAFKTTWPLFAGLFAILIADYFILKNKIFSFILNFFSHYKRILTLIIAGLFLASILFVLANTYFGMKIFNFESIIASPKGTSPGIMLLAGKILADIYSLIFAISPLAFIFILVAIFYNLKGKSTRFSYENRIIFCFILFIFLYYFASTFNSVVATVRYQIALYPLVFIIAAIGFSEVRNLLKIKKFHYAFLFFALIFILLVGELNSVKPFYFAYASDLLPKKYLVNLKDMGDGSFEAAQYLNNLPNSENLIIWSDKGAVCAEFKGKCIIGFKRKDLLPVHFDYFVTSSGRKSRSLKISPVVDDYFDFQKAYETEDGLTYKIIMAGRENNFVKIVPSALIYKK